MFFDCTVSKSDVLSGKDLVVVACHEGIRHTHLDLDFVRVAIHYEVVAPGRLSNFKCLSMIVQHNLTILILVVVRVA